MHHSHPSSRQSRRSRCLSLLLAFALTLGLLPNLDLSGSGSAHWADPYLSQLVEWGFIRSDQSQAPNDELTRADFMAITNRAYGYHENGPTPFEDVKDSDWFYDDVGIAYTAKYIKGTSETTVSPDDTLTRETAATILGRNMMLKESAGEILDFTDARDISTWSRGVIKSSLEHYLVGGYNDGTFRPQNSVTWGEMASMVTKIVGTPLQEAGDYSLGGVFGNVTISSPGVTLRDTVISGDLYVTGGVGLGGIVLENVIVLGRIICSGTGEAESGEASILLRNVTADELLIDSLQGKTVSVQADGVTEIGKTQIRTSAYVQDNTPDGMGLHSIVMDAPLDEDTDPLTVTFAGRVEEVLNISPESTVHVAKGTLAKLTVDEAAVDSLVVIDRGGEVKELNLDVGTTVTGEGDIKHLNVNAPGCVVDILPEVITIRPGTTAVIDGEEMDTIDAEQSNMEPQILSGYPYASDIAPNSISAIFAANKKGTIYWAVSPITDGSVATEDLIKPPAYGGISIARGSVKVPAADTEVRAAVTGLTPGGVYYLSAVMVDDRGVQSPTKVISFETPDNSVPAFAQGYPYFSLIEDTRAQIAVMPTKDCVLYYAVLPLGAAAPTEAELKTSSVSGALGYGVRPVTKNVADLFWVNDLPLEEQVSYDLYLWLVDANGANKSKIVKLTFKTVDKTPPEFIIDPTPNKIQDKSVGLTFRLNENGTVYWAIVPAGKEFLLPNRAAGETTVNWSSDYAKLQVISGMNAQSFGNVKATENKDGTITVNGLEAEKAYDFYYVAVDTAGNYSRTVKMITINSLDNNGPKFSQIFTKHSGLDETTNPMVDTGIILRVSENIRADVEGAGEDLLTLYEASVNRNSNEASRKEAKDKLLISLKNTIVLNRVLTDTGLGSQPVAVKGNANVGDNWVIDYEKVTLKRNDDGLLEITFPSDGLQLDSGATYYFTVSNITDTSTAQNKIVPSIIDFYTNASAGAAAGHNLRPFTTMLGQLRLVRTGLDPETEWPTSGNTSIDIDYSFRVVPISTKNMENNMCYELLFFTDSVINFDLYYRVVKENNVGDTTPIDLSLPANAAYLLPNLNPTATSSGAGWYSLGDSDLIRGREDEWAGVGLNGYFNGCNQGNYPKLNNLVDDGKTYYEFAIAVKQKDGSDNRGEWNGDVTIRVYAAAAPSVNLAASLTARPVFNVRWPSFVENGLTNTGGVSIGMADQDRDYLELGYPFTDSRIPSFANNRPTITPGDTFVVMDLALDQTSPGSVISYVVAPTTRIEPVVMSPHTGDNQQQLGREDLWKETPPNGSLYQPGVSGTGVTPQTPADIRSPKPVAIAEPQFGNDPLIKVGNVTSKGNNTTDTVTVTELQPLTDYYVYFVISNTSKEMSPIFMYEFTTSNISAPKINLSRNTNGTVNVQTHVPSKMDYNLATDYRVKEMGEFSQQKLSDDANRGDFVGKIPDEYAKMNLLDAMFATYTLQEARRAATGANGDYSGYYIPEEYAETTSSLGYSVFDVYASEAIKLEVSRIIRGGSRVQGSLASGSTDTSMDWSIIDERNQGMTVGSRYVLLTVAHHENGTIDSFKALDNIEISDETPPKPVAIYTDIPDGNMQQGIQGKTFSGTVTIVFDKDLYWVSSTTDKNAHPVWSTSQVNPNTTGTDWVGFWQKVNNHNSNFYVSENKTTTGVSFTVNFNNISNGASFTVFDDGFWASSSATAESIRMILTFEVKESGNKTTAGFTSNWTKNRVDYRNAEFNVGSDTVQMNLMKNPATTSGGTFGSSGSSYTLNFNLDSGTTAADILASVVPDDGSFNIVWSSSNTNVATVVAGGNRGLTSTITPVGIGKATITAKAGSVAVKTIEVTVTATVNLDKADGDGVWSQNGTDAFDLNLVTGTGHSATIRCTRASGEINNTTTVTWQAAPANVVNVAQAGSTATITPLKAGTAKITVTIGGIVTKTINVTVTDPPTSDSGLNIAGPMPIHLGK